MKINYYYNFTCPHCYIAYQNMIKALNNLNLNPKINFIPTNSRGKKDISIKEKMTDYKMDLSFLDLRKNTDFANKVMLYTPHQQKWFEIITYQYFYNHLDIENQTQVIQYFSEINLSEEDLPMINQVNLEDCLSDSSSTLLQIGEYYVDGIKDVGYYEFAFSCFYNEQREVEIEIGECFCQGKYCE